MKKDVSILNRRAKFDYEFLDKFEAGIMLKGSEVKAIREGKVSFVDSYCYFHNEELYLKNLDIASKGDIMFSHDSKRDRKLLLKRKELNRLIDQLQKGLSIIPVKIYSNSRTLIKLEIALSRGKKNYDKRESIKARDIDRETRRELT